MPDIYIYIYMWCLQCGGSFRPDTLCLIPVELVYGIRAFNADDRHTTHALLPPFFWGGGHKYHIWDKLRTSKLNVRYYDRVVSAKCPAFFT